MKTRIQSIFLFGVGFFLWACSGNNKQTSDEIKEIMQTQKIKKVTDADILNAAILQGAKIADSTQKVLGQNLMKHMASGGVLDAIAFCSTEALPLTDSLSRRHNAAVKRTSLKVRNLTNAPDSTEHQILEAYQYAFDQKQQLSESVQILTDNTVLYTRPIMTGNPACLQCHGVVGENLLTETNDLIKKHYPEDSATGYALNAFRGMWSIRLDRKEIVNGL